MTLTRRKVFISIFLLVGVIALAIVVFTSGPASMPMPNPNGYDDIVKAGQRLHGDFSVFRDLDREALVELVSTNRDTLDSARLGISRKCLVPRRFIATNDISGMDLVSIKRLAQVFAGEGRLAEFEGRTNDAIRSYMDAIRVGNESSRGGLLINRLVGVACEGIGMIQITS